MRKFWLDCLIATNFVFLAMWAIVGITNLQMFNAFDSIGIALGDVELTDYVFSRIRETPKPDTSITVVNIGNLSRREIAEQIRIISKYKPKIIGIDAFFDCRGNTRDTINCPALRDVMGNYMLASAIQEAGNVILVTKAIRKDSLLSQGVFDSLRRSDFSANAYGEGFANLDTDAAFQEDSKTCRQVNPRLYDKDGKPQYAFSVAMAMAYDSVKAKEFLKRDNYKEIINYRGTIYDTYGQTQFRLGFYALDVNDILTENFQPNAIKDKIVIMGFLGNEFGDPSWADRFYTPLNTKMAGKANPDMFGAVIHANVVSMILNGNYINEMADWQEELLAFVLCLLNVALFSLINTRWPTWYDGITKLLQLTQLLLYTVLMVFIFQWFSFKLNITLTLAAVALVGDVYEIYMSVIKNLIQKIIHFLPFTRHKEEVLMP
jgi:CHASE2 domain-containing sensor protein